MIRVTGLSCEKQDLFALRKIIGNTISHPELRPFHAELLLSKAVLLHQMGDDSSVRQAISRLESDFASMTSMLVLYPTGEAVTLGQGLALLRMQTRAP